MPVQMKCQKRFLKPGHRNPFLRILLACGDNGIFTTLWIQVKALYLPPCEFNRIVVT